MANITNLIDVQDPRISLLRGGEITGTGPILFWFSRSKRASGNRAADVAIELANRTNREVIALFCLVPAFPAANLRSYHFMTEGLRELPAAFAARGVGYCLRQGEPGHVLPYLARELDAMAVVTDLDPLRSGQQWRKQVAAAVSCPMIMVDADSVVPTSFLLKEEWAAHTIRPKLQRYMPGALFKVSEPTATHRSSFTEAPEPLDLLAGMSLDRSVSPSTRFDSGPTAAEAVLQRFVQQRLPTYATDRNRPDIDGSSELSPYLHFGQIEPAHIVRQVLAAGASGVPQESIDAFLNEVVIWRELAMNFALHNPDYDRYAGLPDWGRKTLADHANDQRSVVYDLATLEAGETADPLWNAAQRQMVCEGYMPNRLRMYWAKQLLHWTASPEEAHANAIYLNDRYFLDGRDPNGYAGIAWAIGGRFDRPFPPNKPVFGLIRPMGAKGMKKYFDPQRYIDNVNQRCGGLDERTAHQLRFTV